MRQARVLIALFLLATVLVDAAMLTAIAGSGEWRTAHREVAEGILGGLACSQVSLAAFWLALGRSPLPWRAAGTVAAIVVWSWSLAVVFPAPQGIVPDLVAAGFLIQAAFVGLFTVAARVSCVRWVAPDSPVTTDAPENRRFQFSIRALFAWTTSLAMILSMLRVTIHPEYMVLRHAWADLVMRDLLIGMVAIACLAVGPGTRWGCLVAVPCAAIAILSVLHREETAAILALDAACLLASLWVFRAGGYRLRRRTEAAGVIDGVAESESGR